MRYGFVAAIAGAMLVGLPAAATAAPLIIATNVAAKSAIATSSVNRRLGMRVTPGQSPVRHYQRSEIIGTSRSGSVTSRRSAPRSGCQARTT